MTRLLAIIGGLLAVLAVGFEAEPARSAQVPTPAFRPLTIELSSASSIAAYQLEITVTAGEASFVGIEGGEAPFDAPPSYDPEALSDTRIIVAAFDTTAALPPGTHRVATLHVRELGPGAAYQVRVLAVANSAAERVTAAATIARNEERP
ncbi:MAG TPA: hypothetical protein VML75_21410 [Kofleriaceae bacterium]|nr:hypothetical protein [Kofleriaceae bacterium]